MKKKNDELYLFRMKHERADRTDVEALKADTERYLARHKPKKREREILAGTWAFVAENIERNAWRSYTREEWAELEFQHVEKAKYTEPDLFDDILTEYEADRLTEAEAKAVAKEYRACSYLFCLNVYKPGRKDQRYCCGDCRRRQSKAAKRYEQTGTYLPAEAYKDNREATEQRKYVEAERSFDEEMLNDVIRPTMEKREYGGKRNRAHEDEMEIIYDKLQEKDEKQAEKRTEKHVNSEGFDGVKAQAGSVLSSI